MTIRDFEQEHWADAARIYAEGLDLGTFEERVPSWERWDQGHLTAPRVVAEVDGSIAGWAALAPVSQRECYRGVVEVSVYVGETARGRGVGRALLSELVRRADEHGIWTIQANVLAGNHASVALHKACGFRVVGTRERIAQKRGAWLDVTLMERRSALA